MKNPSASPSPRIRHREILDQIADHAALINGYRDKVLTRQTRTIRLLGRKNSAKILNTLLGFEVQSSYKRIQCPDMVTARYIRLFSELGCHSIKLPYDPTVTELLIPEFEAVVDRIKERIRELFPHDLSTQRYVLRTIYGIIRRELAAS